MHIKSSITTCYAKIKNPIAIRIKKQRRSAKNRESLCQKIAMYAPGASLAQNQRLQRSGGFGNMVGPGLLQLA